MKIPATYIVAGLYALLLGLQALPFIGPFLVLFEVWVGLFPNLIFLALLIDIYRKKLPSFLLLLPLIFYGFYYTVSFVELWSIKKTEKTLSAENARLSIPFDLKNNDLIISNGIMGINDALDFIDSHKLAVVYEPVDDKNYVLFRTLTQNLCEDLLKSDLSIFKTELAFCAPSPYYADKGAPLNISNLRMPGRPDKNIIWVGSDYDFQSLPDNNWGPASIEEHHYTFKDKNNNILAVYKTAEIERLSWFPSLALGCMPNDSFSEWECFYILDRTWEELDTMPPDINTKIYGKNPIATVLKIPQYQPDDYTKFQNYAETIDFIHKLLNHKIQE